MNLTPHFTLAEMTATSTGLPNSPSPEVACSLRVTCAALLEPIRLLWGGPVMVTSGYRSEAVNVAVGGSGTSLHLTGEAADIHPLGMDGIYGWDILIQAALRDRLQIDEAIYYPRTGHIHVGYMTTSIPRRRLWIKDGDRYTRVEA